VKYQKGFWAKRKIKNKYAADFQVFSEAVLQLEDVKQKQNHLVFSSDF